MVKWKDTSKVLGGFFLAMFMVNLYFAVKEIYLPVFGITVGPQFFWIRALVDGVSLLVFFWMGFKP